MTDTINVIVDADPARIVHYAQIDAILTGHGLAELRIDSVADIVAELSSGTIDFLESRGLHFDEDNRWVLIDSAQALADARHLAALVSDDFEGERPNGACDALGLVGDDAGDDNGAMLEILAEFIERTVTGTYASPIDGEDETLDALVAWSAARAVLS